MRKLVIILDPAHGSDVPGKSSPDGSFKEYQYSREILNKLKPKLEAEGFRVEFSNTTDKEIGLSKRVKFATDLEIQKTQSKVFFSLHNNASGYGKDWAKARGFEIWVKPSADPLTYKVAKYIIESLSLEFPDYKMRVLSPKEVVKSANFVVLGGKFPSVLLEWLFMDNQEDLAILKDEKEKDKLVEALTSIFIQLDDNWEYLNKP